MSSQVDDFIYNWSNSLRQNEKGEQVVAVKLAFKLKQQGYSPSDASDILIAENFSDETVDFALRECFSNKTNKQNNVKIATPVKEYINPTSYEDLKHNVEHTLKETSPKEFVNMLVASGNDSIIPRISEANYKSLIRLAAAAKEDNFALQQLHSELSPYFELTILESVKLAEKSNFKKVKTANKHSYVVTSANKEQYNLELNKPAICDCDRYDKAHFASFGIPCEHVIAITNEISPNEKVAKDELE